MKISGIDNILATTGHDWHTQSHTLRLPQRSCVYAIFIDSKLLYVGSTANLRSRFGNHQIRIGRVNYRPFEGNPETAVVAFTYIDNSDIRNGLERDLIGRLNPPHNIHFRRSA
jgi:excinuclease UvrABC nuclease subunit